MNVKAKEVFPTVVEIFPTVGKTLQLNRQKMGMTLNTLATTKNQDMGRLSKIENGHLPPPVGEEALTALLEAYGISSGSPAFHALANMAAIENGRIPRDMVPQTTGKREMWLQFIEVIHDLVKKPEKFQKAINYARRLLATE